MFDCKHKVFKAFEMSPPPGISYGEFSDPHVMCVEHGSILIHTPGKASLIFDESRKEWLTHHRRLPPYPDHHTPTDLPYHGYEVYSYIEEQVFILQNPAAYTSSTTCVSENLTRAQQHPPPPMDGISLITTGMCCFFKILKLCNVACHLGHGDRNTVNSIDGSGCALNWTSIGVQPDIL